MLKQIWTLVFLLYLSSAAYAHECSELLRRQIQPWKFGEIPSLNIVDIIPSSFQKELEDQFGEVSLSMNYTDNRTLSVVLRANKITVIRFKFIDEGVSNTIRIESLGAVNPLNSKSDIKLSQSAKGLPADVFRYARNRVKEIARQGGYSYIYAVGAQNYLVLALYTKILGMKAVTKTGEQYLKMLDEHYSYARKKFPDAYRPKNLNDFSSSIGDYYYFMQPSEALVLYQEYLATGKLSKKIKILKNDQQLPIAILYHSERNQPHVLYLNTSDPKFPIFQFKDFAADRKMGLVMSTDLD